MFSSWHLQYLVFIIRCCTVHELTFNQRWPHSWGSDAASLLSNTEFRSERTGWHRAHPDMCNPPPTLPPCMQDILQREPLEWLAVVELWPRTAAGIRAARVPCLSPLGIPWLVVSSVFLGGVITLMVCPCGRVATLVGGVWRDCSITSTPLLTCYFLISRRGILVLWCHEFTSVLLQCLL